MDSSESAIKIENVWKVFGNTSNEALEAIHKDWQSGSRIPSKKSKTKENIINLN